MDRAWLVRDGTGVLVRIGCKVGMVDRTVGGMVVVEWRGDYCETGAMGTRWICILVGTDGERTWGV